MEAFSYAKGPVPIRTDLAEAHRRTWAHVASPGTWLTGDQRVAVAEETRRARDCALCRERKAALSPFAVEGEHDHGGVLPAPLVDEIHRVTTDAQRLTRAWQQELLAQGLPVEQYVEALGVAVLVIGIDRVHHALGLAPEPLPDPLPGAPRRTRPSGLVEGEAWVPMLHAKAGGELGLPTTPGGRIPNVVRALSLVPAEVAAWIELSDAQYLGPVRMRGFETGRSIDRAQMELVAGRVSALNECFY